MPLPHPTRGVQGAAADRPIRLCVDEGSDLVPAKLSACGTLLLLVAGLVFQAASAVAQQAPPPLPRLDHTEFEFAPPRPNPAHGRAVFEFTLPRSAPVTITVYDMAGRRIRTIADESLAPGRHVRTWDLRTDRGTRAPSGIYFACFGAPGVFEVRRTVLIR